MLKLDVKKKKDMFSFLIISTKITGNVVSIDNIRVAGLITGDVIVKQKLVIGKSAVIVGNVEAEDIYIEGKLTGNLKVSNVVNVQSDAIINGNIYAYKIAVSSGAIINGKIITIPKDKT